MQPNERQWLEVTYAEHHAAVCGFPRSGPGDLDRQAIAQDVLLTALPRMDSARIAIRTGSPGAEAVRAARRRALERLRRAFEVEDRRGRL